MHMIATQPSRCSWQVYFPVCIPFSLLFGGTQKEYTGHGEEA